MSNEINAEACCDQCARLLQANEQIAALEKSRDEWQQHANIAMSKLDTAEKSRAGWRAKYEEIAAPFRAIVNLVKAEEGHDKVALSMSKAAIDTLVKMNAESLGRIEPPPQGCPL